MNDHMLSRMWDEITNPFPNSNGCTFEVGEYFMVDVTT